MGALGVAGLIGLGVLVLVVGAGGAELVLSGATKLTPDGTVSLDGVEPADPRALARGAGMDFDPYALARMLESEVAGLPTVAFDGVAHAALNFAGSRSIGEILIDSTGAGDGFFGRQRQGRYAATSKDPLARSRAAALAAVRGESEDPTGGADQWDSPQSYEDPADADATAAKRMAAGKEMVLLSGVPERKLRFWRRT